jgi:hypothetical protein
MRASSVCLPETREFKQGWPSQRTQVVFTISVVESTCELRKKSTQYNESLES